MHIYYDSYHEGVWFQGLHRALAPATLSPFPSAKLQPAGLARVLAYDRPDIVLVDGAGEPILVLERTIEVPSGHNVGQRFARIAAAARAQVPAVYFGPYSAYKHGGITRGPRYMNLRLFHGIDETAAIEDSPITTIRWPTDDAWEIIQTPEKDLRVQMYLKLFFDVGADKDPEGGRRAILSSTFEGEQEDERQAFIAKEVKNRQQYDVPPPSVQIGALASMALLSSVDPALLVNNEVLLYSIGMRNIRSDPYTGTAILYAYLYCGGMASRKRDLVLHFPEVDVGRWDALAHTVRKDVRLFREVADGILFKNAYRHRSAL